MLKPKLDNFNSTDHPYKIGDKVKLFNDIQKHRLAEIDFDLFVLRIHIYEDSECKYWVSLTDRDKHYFAHVPITVISKV